ncbi:hypothetical protein E1263_25970 [Kribbella antibiotica]|uniref:Uncharacterized protein n=1 Tax=Kribbella antibiotica TaxID=190195 RepID=A0A4R4ZDZ5_9ACTN|nr:hypothetical protein [Kribbella antibiotica]TDD55724.1 hypothetical protein E1263_25970 [Kribbella antibiotica]
MIRRTLAVLAVLVTFTVATPAHAGGPTSVLLSAPPHVAAVGYDNPQYAELQRLTSAEGTRSVPGDTSHEAGAFVRATWLIHDMNVWRIDIIYPDAAGGPWIATSESKNGSPELSKPVWHTSTDPVALTKLLGSLKLLPGLRNGEQFVGGPTTLAQPQAEPEPQPAIVKSSIFTGWRWLLPGVLVGALITWAATRLLRQRRWDLIDAD